ncbi:MAG: hypothetical protein KAT68_03600 [Bacteroidales bacterium]|nr:hypothetical protein [Bacteroidales bacterium]
MLFTSSNKSVTDSNRFTWFEKWVIGRRTLEQLTKESGYSEKSLRRYFKNRT